MGRKRHLGNDIVVVVFQDGTTPFDVTSVRSEFNHVWCVVQPLKLDGRTHYRLAFVAKPGVPTFGPPIAQSIYAPDAAFRNFLLAKLINAERAAYAAPAFSTPIRRTRQMLLDGLARKLATPLKTSASSTH